MFTGLIQQQGRIRRISRGRSLVIEVEADTPWTPPLEEGESVAVSGVCLTVVGADPTRFTADVLAETEARSTLAGARPGARVNLERALKAGDALGGHLVQGHVDTVGTLIGRKPRARDVQLKFRCGRVLAAQSVLKGSIAIDGVSLTVSDLGEDFIAVDVIPTTAAATTLGGLKLGDKVNLEGDIVGKYVAKNAQIATGGGLTEEKLREAGFFA